MGVPQVKFRPTHVLARRSDLLETPPASLTLHGESLVQAVYTSGPSGVTEHIPVEGPDYVHRTFLLSQPGVWLLREQDDKPLRWIFAAHPISVRFEGEAPDVVTLLGDVEKW
jgi:hypothetical protein